MLDYQSLACVFLPGAGSSDRRPASCRINLVRLFILVAPAMFLPCTFSQAQNNPKSVVENYEWGSVTTQNDGKGLTLSLTINSILKKGGLSSAKQAAAATLANAARVIQTKPVFPQYEFCLVLPPNSTLRVGTVNVRTTAANLNDPIVVAGYQSANDSSSMIPVYRTLTQVGLLPTEPVLKVTGYEWYRGYRLARLIVTPYQQQAPGYRFTTNVDVRLEFQSVVGSPVVVSKSADPQFDAVFKRLVANAGDLTVVGQTKMAQNDSTGNWILWGRPAIKLGIAEDGVYRVTFQNVQALVSAAGQIDPSTFRLFNRGVEIPVYVAGEQNGLFSQGDYVEFPALRNYGTRDYRSIPSNNEEYPDYLNRYTDTSAYWLTWGGSKGLRMDSSGIVSASTDSLSWYTELIHIEQNHELQFADGSNQVVRQDPRWTSGDIWGWGWLFSGSVFDVPVSITNLSYAYPSARIYARCASTTWPFGIPSYKLRLSINASDTLQKIDDNGQTPQILLQADAPIAGLSNGTNMVHVYSLPTPSSVNATWFDWAEVEYPRNLVASGDTLVFGFPWLTNSATRTVVVAGLVNQNIVVYKYFPGLKRITNATPSGAPPYTLSFTDTVSPGDRYMLWEVAKVKTPQTMTVKNFPNLRDPSRGADYILVTSQQFESTANSYAAFIGSKYNLRTTVVDVDDIFNEFGFGYPTGESIREFLKATSAWQAPMPSYVFLVGDGTYDYKSYVSSLNPQNRPVNSVPTYGEPVSDPWLAVLDDSSIIPQMYIGRIPVNTNAEFTRYYQRVQSYIAGRNDDWNKRYIFFAGGDPGVPGQVESFRQTNESIISSMVNPIPIGGIASDFYKTTNPQTDFGPYSADQFQKAIDNGAVFISYIGHSGTQTWDNSIGSVTQLQNTRNRFPLISDFGCSTAKFAEPDIKCFGELFTLDPDGSAIAYVGNTALGFVSIALTLPPLFYKQFLQNQVYQIGKAHLLGKIEAMNQMGGPNNLLSRVMMLTNSLLGDPAIQLAIPQKPNLAIKAGTVSTSPSLPSDDQDSLTLIVPYMNTGRVTTDTMKVDIQHTYNGATSDTAVVRALPLFLDTLEISYLAKDRAGDHTFNIQLNADGRVPEIQSDDNAGSYSAAVLSSSLKIVTPLSGYETPPGDLVFLNPVKKVSQGNPSLMVEIDTTQGFSTSFSVTEPFGFVSTRIPLPSLVPAKTYFWRAGILNSTAPKVLGRFVFNGAGVTRWHPTDSTAWSQHSFLGAKYIQNQGVTIADRKIDLQVISSGFDDGTFGAVNINGINVLPNTFSRGHSVVVFDTADISIKDTRVFDNFGSSAQAESLQTYLTALPFGTMVVDLIIDEGSANFTPAVLAAIHSIGSLLIDSIGYRDSWAIIGRKGAIPGTVPEQWKRRGSGKVELDTVFIRKVSSGTVESPIVGPVGAWKSVSFSGVTPPGTALALGVLGIRKSGNVDTLLVGQTGPTVSLVSYSPKLYPELRISCNLTTNSGGQSPTLTDWSLNVDLPAELAINYQSVTISADTVLEGADPTIKASVYNVGSVAADSVLARLTSIGPYGFQTVDSVLLGTIAPDSFKTTNLTFPTTGKRGLNTLFIEVDPHQRVNELYKSNNVTALPLFVRSDTAHPTFTISVDGSPVYDGDYVSTNPTIMVDVFDSGPLPITDPTSIVLIMDHQLVTLGTNPDSLFESGTGPDKARVTYRPRLQKGEHTLSVQVKDATGNFADTTARQVTFKVETEPGLLNVFNYPNPFARQTQFTFNLVGSKLPDELKIKIYSIAGRLVQELTVWRGDLRIGFNRVSWDGRDRDGDELANGVYFYRIVMNVDGKMQEVLQKLAKVK
jgi:hypothetical protein